MARGEGRRFAELLGASALALGVPLLDVFGRSTETFVFRGVDGTGYVGFALAVLLAPPLGLWLGGRVVGRLAPRAREAIHVLTIAVLVAVWALVAVRWMTGLRGGVALAVAGAAAGLVVVGYRGPAAPRFFAYLAVLPALSLYAFLTDAPASALLRSGQVEIATGAESEVPVVMLVLDELPTTTLLDDEGAVDAVRFPNLSRLAAESAWYRNHTTVSASTVRAVPTILTGVMPGRDQEPLWTDRPDSLFTLLAGSHQLRVRETVTRLCPPAVCDEAAELTRAVTAAPSGLSGLGADAVEVLGQLVDPRSSPRPAVDAFQEEVIRLDPPAATTAADDEAVVQPRRFADFVADLVAADEPVLHFLHLILPHGPWRFTHDGTEYEAPAIDPPGQVGGIWTDEWPAALTRLRHELQARYTDRLVGRVMTELQATGLWDTATFVVVADHGGSFAVGERGRALTEGNAADVMWSPLFIRAPGLRPGTTDVNAQSVDLLPTVADLVGVPVPFDTDGRSLVHRSGPDLLPVDGSGGRSGVKQYARFTNIFQPEPDAVLELDGDRELRRVLDGGREVTPEDAADPVGSFHRSTPHGELYGARVGDLDVGEPMATTLRLGQRLALERGEEDEPAPLYLDGNLQGDRGPGDDPWVAIAVDGRIIALSPMFESATADRAVATLADPAMLDPGGRTVEAFVVGDPGDPLRPVHLA